MTLASFASFIGVVLAVPIMLMFALAVRQCIAGWRLMDIRRRAVRVEHRAMRVVNPVQFICVHCGVLSDDKHDGACGVW
jgi:hypothetical protein